MPDVLVNAGGARTSRTPPLSSCVDSFSEHSVQYFREEC